MGFLLNPYRYVTAGGGLPDDVIAYQASPSSNIFDFQGISFSGYQRAILYLDEITVDTANTQIILQFYIAGSLITSNSYNWLFSFAQSATGATAGEVAGASNIRLTTWADTGSNLTWNGVVHICAPEVGVNKLAHFGGAFVMDNGSVAETTGVGSLANTGSITGLKVSGSGGLITGGRAMILGLPTS